MKIASIQLKKEQDGLSPFPPIALGQTVVVTGSNGSGKTRLLKLLQQHVQDLHNNKDGGDLCLQICSDGQSSVPLTVKNADLVQVANYSHFDAQLQLPGAFPPYVICQAKDLLDTCDYEETALNSLLLLEDMAKGYSEEFQDGAAFEEFVEKFARPFQLEVQRDEKRNLKLFGRELKEARLSPGQQYLLRIAVACYRNRSNEKIVFLLDEPELHLHPKAQIDLINALRAKFSSAQFWICTHSLSLVSYLTVSEKDTTVLYMRDGQTGLFRSNSSDILEGLIGAEENRFAIRQLLAEPDEYACNKFAVECFREPGVNGAGTGGDPQAGMLGTIFRKGDVVVDFGVGKGRVLGELSMGPYRDVIPDIQYFAYDPSKKHAADCKAVMKSCGIPADHYYNAKAWLRKRVGGQADHVLLVNVLHEIDPKYWEETFALISGLLKDGGHLVIVEREELTVGEAPYDSGFLVLTEASVDKLFSPGRFPPQRHEKKPYIVKYSIPKAALAVSRKKVRNCITQIQTDSIREIREIKGKPAKDDLARYKAGIKLAFHLHQYANASLVLKSRTI